MKVMVCRSALLLPTETFIKDQVSTYGQWRPTLAGFERVPGGLPLDAMEVLLLERADAGQLSKAWRKCLRELWLAPGGALASMRRQAADLIHVHFGTDAVVFWPLIEKLNIPVVITLHGYDINIYREFWEGTGLRLSTRRYPSRLLAISRHPQVHFVAVSKAIRERAIEYGLPPERIAVRHIGIDTSQFRFSGTPVNQRNRRVLFIGRLVEKKGAEFLIRACARLQSAVPDVELVVVGTGPQAEILRELSRQLGVAVQFLGTLPRSEVKKELDRARVFCLPSVTASNGDAEGFGMVILEAQSSGVPVVTSARGGATEAIIDGLTGWAFPERDVDALVDRLHRLLTDDDAAISMSEAGIAHVGRNFDLRACTKKLEQHYDSIVTARPYTHV
jgi:glycosyltransferase involved in cell wall biosynthesis